MAKRFTDTNKYKKPFIRGLQGAYKIFWDYLYHECDHAGIWIVDFEVAQLYVGKDMPISREYALKYFNATEQKIIEVDNQSRWFIPSFIEFQYGVLNRQNRAHSSVITILEKYNLYTELSPLQAPSQGAMDMDMVKDKDLLLIKGLEINIEFAAIFLNWLHYKRKRGESYKTTESTFLAYKKLLKLSENNPMTAIEIVNDAMASNYAGFFQQRPTFTTPSKSGSRPGQVMHSENAQAAIAKFENQANGN